MPDIVCNGRPAEFHKGHAHLHRLTFVGFIALSLADCHRFHDRPGPLSTQGFRYRAGSAVVGANRDTLRVVVVVVNESDQQRMIGFSHCPWYANGVQALVAVSGRRWDSQVNEENHAAIPRDSIGKPIPMACDASLAAMTFPPGDSYASVLKVPVREILGDSLPSGRYRVTTRLVSNGGDGRKLDAGEVVLR
jgi:hypothetical protein